MNRSLSCGLAAGLGLLGLASSAWADMGLHFAVNACRSDQTLVYYYVYASADQAPAGYTTVDVYSPTGLYHGQINQGSSGSVGQVRELVDSINGQWNVVLDEGLATEKRYHLSVGTTLSDAVFPDWGIDSPAPGPLAGNLASFSSHGPTDFDNIGEYMTMWGGSDYIFNHSASRVDEQALQLPSQIAPVTLASPLEIGDYTYRIGFSRNDISSLFTFTALVDDLDQPLDGVTMHASLHEEATTYFSVVPEPTSIAWLGLASVLFFPRRSSQA